MLLSNRINKNSTNGLSVYDSDNTKKYRRDVRKKVTKRYNQSAAPLKNGVIRNYFNKSNDTRKRRHHAKYNDYDVEHFNNTADSLFSDNESRSDESKQSKMTMEDHMTFFKKGNMLKNNQHHENKFTEQATKENNSSPNFLSQFRSLSYDNPSAPVSSNNANEFTGQHSRMAKMELERNLALKNNYSKFAKSTNMTYGITKDMTHNNMVPFFKKKTYGQDPLHQQKMNEVHQRKMERFSGSSKNIEYRPKTERRPLFNPHVGLTNIYGMPSFTNYTDGRFIPGRERRNEKLMQPTRVTPGLNLGYNEISTKGFHDSYRPLPPTVDELRAANNPKISYGGVVIAGQKAVKRGIIPNMAKRSPTTFFEQDPRDFQKSRGYITAPAIYGNFDAPTNMRQLSENLNYVGPAGTKQLNKGGYIPNHSGTFAKSTLRQTTQHNTYQGPLGTKALNKGGYTAQQSGTIAPTTMRQTTQHTTYQGPLGTKALNKGGYTTQQSGTIAPTTMRQLTQNTTYQGALGTNALNKGGYTTQQAGTIAPTTMRQLTQNTTYQGALGTTQLNKGGYTTQQAGTIAPTTMRQLTQNTTYQGALGTNALNKGGYIAQQSGTIAPTTMRQLTQNTTYLGSLGTKALNKGGYTTQQAGTIAPTTLRQLTQNKTYQGPLGTQQLNKGGYTTQQAGTIAPTTLRQLTQNTTYQGPLGTSQLNKGGYTAEHSNTIAPTTLRQLTQHKTYQGPLGTQQLNKGGYVAQHSNTVAPTTLRQLTQHKTYQGPAHLHQGNKTRTRKDAENSLVNIAKDIYTTIRDGGRPTNSNYNKGPVFDHTMVQMCEPIQLNRDIYGDQQGQRPLQCLPLMHTRTPNVLPQQSWRFDEHITASLSTNPYINNTQHKSVEF